jgi:hypothetical protein
VAAAQTGRRTTSVESEHHHDVPVIYTWQRLALLPPDRFPDQRICELEEDVLAALALVAARLQTAAVLGAEGLSSSECALDFLYTLGFLVKKIVCW